MPLPSSGRVPFLHHSSSSLAAWPHSEHTSRTPLRAWQRRQGQELDGLFSNICLLESVGEAWRRVPNALGPATPPGPAAPGLHCSGLRWRRHACFSAAVPDSLSLEVGGRSRPPPTRRPTTGFEAHPLVRRQPIPSTLEPRRKNEYVPRNISFLGATGPEGRITADWPPPPSQYCCPLSTTPTKYRRGAEAKAGGERATSFLGALQQCSPGAQLLHVLLLEKRLHLVSTRHLSPASSSPSPSISPLPCSLHPPRPSGISRIVAKIPS